MTLTINKNPEPNYIIPDCIRLTLLPGEIYIRELIISNLNGSAQLEYIINKDTLATWLTLSESNGIISPGAEKIIYDTINATGLSPDVYSTVLEITTDPNLSEVHIPITLTVITAADTINCQRIPLPRGWSYISSYIQPDDPQLEKVFENQVICNTMVILLNKTGIFWPSQNINTIGNFTPYVGYKNKMNVNDQWIVCGMPVVDKTVNTPKGVSYLPVLSSCPVKATDIFSQIEDHLVFAFEITQQEVYWPAGLLYSLDTLWPGKAYLINMLSPDSVIYPPAPCLKSNQTITESKSKKIENLPWTITNTGSAHIISVYASALSNFDKGDVIAAFNNENLCVGMSVIEDLTKNLGLIIYGDDFTTESIDGMHENEPIRLKLYKPNTHQEYDLDFEFDGSSLNTLPVFVEHGLSKILKISTISNVNAMLYSNSDIRVFPNPAKDEIIVSIVSENIKECSLRICNIDGKLINLIKIDQINNLININNLQPGVYILRFETEGTIINKKLIKQ
jgi:hypothetical protein